MERTKPAGNTEKSTAAIHGRARRLWTKAIPGVSVAVLSGAGSILLLSDIYGSILHPRFSSFLPSEVIPALEFLTGTGLVIFACGALGWSYSKMKKNETTAAEEKSKNLRKIMRRGQ